MATNTTSTPTPDPPPLGDSNPPGQTAADLIRHKVARVYETEPNALQELAESEQVTHLSKHQKFMYELGNSGKDLATIQTAWHQYYQGLPDHEKHQVWQEFYASQSVLVSASVDPSQQLAEHKHQAASGERAKARARQPRKLREARSSQAVKAAIRDKVSAGGKLEAKHHLQSLLFGLGMGLLVVFIFLFGFFNEVFIAPFIQPSRAAASTPLIISEGSVAPTATPEVIIPKINVEIPVDYNQTSIDERLIENALDSGVVHYPTTSKPGETGNVAIFGHSSNNIFNKGKYKFAFVMLRTLEKGDTFYLTYNSKVYVYKVYDKQVVDPSNVSVLNPVPGQTATATLITCDPPGTSLKRMVIVGQQISPNPAGNVQTSAHAIADTDNQELPGNGPTLWGRLVRSIIGKAVVATIAVSLGWVAFQWTRRQLNYGRST